MRVARPPRASFARDAFVGRSVFWHPPPTASLRSRVAGRAVNEGPKDAPPEIEVSSEMVEAGVAVAFQLVG